MTIHRRPIKTGIKYVPHFFKLFHHWSLMELQTITYSNDTKWTDCDYVLEVPVDMTIENESIYCINRAILVMSYVNYSTIMSNIQIPLYESFSQRMKQNQKQLNQIQGPVARGYRSRCLVSGTVMYV